MALTPSLATGRTPKNVTCGCSERMVLFRHLSCSKPEGKKRVRTTKTKSLSDDLVLGVLINSIAMVMSEGTRGRCCKAEKQKAADLSPVDGHCSAVDRTDLSPRHLSRLPLPNWKASTGRTFLSCYFYWSSCQDDFLRQDLYLPQRIKIQARRQSMTKVSFKIGWIFGLFIFVNKLNIFLKTDVLK